jgi:hypothetical protein
VRKKSSPKASLEGATSGPGVGPILDEDRRADAMSGVAMGPGKTAEPVQSPLATGIRTTVRETKVAPRHKVILVDRLSGGLAAAEAVQGVNGRAIVQARQRQPQTHQAIVTLHPETVLPGMRKPGRRARPSDH